MSVARLRVGGGTVARLSYHVGAERFDFITYLFLNVNINGLRARRNFCP